MKSSTKVLLGVAAGGWFISDLLKRVPQAVPKPAANQLNGFIDPFTLGLGCDCDLGFVGCADMGVAPARSGVGLLQRPHDVVWKKTGQRPDLRRWLGKNRKNFVLDGVGLAGFISPQTEARLDDPAAYPWGLTGYNSNFNDGLGRFSFKKITQAIIAPVQKAVQVVAAPVKKVAAKAVQQVKKDIKTVEKIAIKQPISALQAATKTIQEQVSKAANVIKTETYLKPKALFSGSKSSAPEAYQDTGSGAIVYQDADGNVITKEEYDRQMAEYNQTPGIMRDYQDADGNLITKEEYDRQMALYNADAATGGSVYDDMTTDAGGTVDSGDGIVVSDGVSWWQDTDGTWYWFDDQSQNWVQEQVTGSTNNSATAVSADDQNWRDRYGDGFITSGFNSDSSYDSGSTASTGTSDGIIYDNGVTWWQEADGTWFWFDDQSQQWMLDEPDGTFVAEVSSPTNASWWDALFDGSNMLGNLYDRRNGRPLAVVTKRRGGASINPLKVDGKGRVFASNGRKHRQVGTVEQMAAAEGQAGLGFSLFGKTFAKFSDFAKDVASKATPSGAIYKL